jgi:aspartate racemase
VAVFVEPAEGEPVLGIIGGAGVGAAARLYIDVSALMRAATGGLPRIALWNLPLTDAIEHAFTAASPAAAMRALVDGLIAEAFDRLGEAGATVIAMPCNSLQRSAAAEAHRRGVPFIDMIAATAAAAREGGARSAVLIATDATHAGGVYDGYGIEIAAPAAELHDETLALIARAVEGPPPSGALLESLIERARRPPAAVVLGCTDICGLLSPARAAELGVVESLGCLAERCAQALGAGAALAR